MPRNLVSQKQAAERYGVTVRTIRNYIAAGKIAGYQLPGGPIRVDLDELDRALVPMKTGWPGSGSSLSKAGQS